MKRNDSTHCSDCQLDVNRRHFLGATAGAAIAVSAAPSIAAPSPKSKAELAIVRLYDSFNAAQKKALALPLSDERRTRINANWRITETMIEELSAEQQAITKDIVRGLTSEEGFELFMKQMDDDWGGLSQYSMAIFGNPHKDRFEFALTGRHLTLRADGNTDNGGSKDGNSGHGVAFGGPIIYGHAEESPKENLFYYQTKQAHEVFKMLDGSQRAKALLAKAPRENAVQIRKPSQALPGISGSELSSDQKDRLEQTLQAVLSPYRKEDVDEVIQLMKASGGLDKVHMAFYRTGAGGETGDVLDDQIWDIWRLESPSLVCHFRGAPHVHAYINVARRA
ncbi:MAG TPA: hypothetical protein DCE55_25740 [Planctomycetaceae bacterium]|nr:hypothetical protein [Planctomycetaceae bacterium]|tara:strand:+ start:6681 stop:7691 length:1011 start_codon:yes stop_codon:yes gene_type:complete